MGDLDFSACRTVWTAVGDFILRREKVNFLYGIEKGLPDTDVIMVEKRKWNLFILLIQFRLEINLLFFPSPLHRFCNLQIK